MVGWPPDYPIHKRYQTVVIPSTSNDDRCLAANAARTPLGSEPPGSTPPLEARSEDPSETTEQWVNLEAEYWLLVVYDGLDIAIDDGLILLD